MVSVIVPIYNAERFLDRCVASIVAQSYYDLEIILVNDGSIDRSEDICRDWQKRDSRIRYIYQKNGGVSVARNAGLEAATGGYVMFVDSDDYMLPDMCKVMYETLQIKQADCVVCGVKETGGGVWQPKENKDYVSFDNFRADFICQLNTELLSPSWNKIFKRRLIMKGFPKGVSFGEDLIFNLEYLKKCNRISFITSALLYHEKDVDGSLVLKSDLGRLLDIEQVLASVLDFYGSATNNVYGKYVRDLVVYSRQMLKSSDLTLRQKRCILTQWRSESHIGRMNINTIKCCWRNKLLLILLKYNCWVLAFLVVNKGIKK